MTGHHVSAIGDAARPPVADRAAFQAGLDRLRVREKAHTPEGLDLRPRQRGDGILVRLAAALGSKEGRFQLDGRPAARWSRLRAGRDVAVMEVRVRAGRVR